MIAFELSHSKQRARGTITALTMVPKTMKAVKVVGADHAEVQEVPVPELQGHEVLVKISVVALNPVDWQVVRTPILPLKD